MAGNLFYGLKIVNSVVHYNVMEVVDKYRSRVPRATWTSPEKLHLTLRFLGKSDALMDDDAHYDVLAKACEENNEFAFTLRGAGLFTPGKPRVLYAAVSDPAPLHRIYKALGGVGGFTPHITLAKLETKGDVAPEFGTIATEISDHGFGKIHVSDLALYRTEGDGKPYTVVGTHRLCK